MSRRKPILLLLIAAILGMLATSAAARYLEQHSKGTDCGATVLTAAVDLKPGTQLTKEHLKPMSWPAGKAPATFAKDFEEAVDKFISTSVTAGEPIHKSSLSDSPLAGAIAGHIPPGYRAMAIQVDRSVKAGLIEAGSFVDVIMVITERGHEPISKIILQSIKVLSVGNRPAENSDKEKDKEAASTPGSEEVVTLLLMPEQAEMLALATSRGKIQLMARGEKDTEASHTAGFSPISFLPERKEPEKPVKQEPAPKADEPKPESVAETLFNKANTLEAKGLVDEAIELYNEISERFPDQKLALAAVGKVRTIKARIEEEQRLKSIETAVNDAKSCLVEGLFEECRTKTGEIMTEFGEVEYQGEKISDIVSQLKLRANDGEKRARTDFQLFRTWLQNGNREKADEYLKRLKERYPQSNFCRQAMQIAAEKDAGDHAAAGDVNKETTEDENE